MRAVVMDPLTRRVAWTASAAAAMTGALLALGAAAFATVAGHEPTVPLLVAFVAGAAVLGAVAAVVMVARVGRVRRALGLEPPRPRLR